MSTIPRAVLSEQFQERLGNRKLLAAIFTTYQFEPSFFETEVLPVFLDVPLSHAPAIRLVQLDDAIASSSPAIAVYYDQNGLGADGGAAKLDAQRIPIRHRTGIFHPKNVLALVEAREPDDNNHRARALLVSCSSANLTRSGWWESVEVAHIEEIREGEHSILKGSLLHFLDALVGAAEGRRANDDLRAAHRAVREIHGFLGGTTQREHRSVDGRLLTQFHDGEQSLPDFIEDAAGRSALRGFCLEVISPFFDAGGYSTPLDALVERFEPAEVRVFLPRNERGEAQCSEALFSWVRARAPRVCWGALPGDLLRLGKAEETKHRGVHAKVYRFFDPKKGGREVLYVGSANLTTPGCRIAGKGGNWETGFLVEMTTGARPEWWLSADTKRPAAFLEREADEAASTSGGTKLQLRFRWDTNEASAFWSDTATSPALAVRHGGVTVMDLVDLPSRTWIVLDRQRTESLRQALTSTSLLEVAGEGTEPALLLVQEEGMFKRPSLVLDLSAADILRYWALLTVEQRAAFIEARARIAGDDDPLVTKLAPLPVETTLFDRFAGVFHAFECLRDRVRAALEEGKTREADYRLFGKKYDSLGSLLDRVLEDAGAGKGDRVEQYVVTLCARQLLRELGRAFPDYWADHAEDAKALRSRIGDASSLRSAIAAGHPEMPTFLDWFDDWFVKRAAALPGEDET